MKIVSTFLAFGMLGVAGSVMATTEALPFATQSSTTQTEKASSFNAPVQQHLKEQPLDCGTEDTVILRHVDLTHVEIQVNDEKVVLEREKYKNLGVIYRKVERSYPVSYRTAKGQDTTHRATWEQVETQGKLTFTADAIQLNAHCSFKVNP